MNRVIVFGNGLDNTLGLVRSVGEAGYLVDLLLVSNEPHGWYVQYSKYLNVVHYLHTQAEGIAVLLEKYAGEVERPIVLFAGDPAVCEMDRRYAELKGSFYFFNAGEPGRINHFMDKINTFPLAKCAGLKLIKTWHVVDVNDLPHEISYPCLIKGANSTTSNKGHMCVCHSATELHDSLCVGIEYLIQEYIQKDYELNLVGLSWNHGECFFAPAVVRKLRDDLHRQSVYIRLDDVKAYPDLDMVAVRRFVKSLRYEGILSIEMIKSRGAYYFLEVNLRNDGCGYLYTVAGVNYPALWIKYCRGELTSDVIASVRAKTPCVLMSWGDMYNMLEGRVPFIKWFWQFISADAHFVMNKKDVKPFLVAFKHSIWLIAKRNVRRFVIRFTHSSRLQTAKIISVVGYYFGLDSFFYWINRGRKRIVNFHNVLPDALYLNDVANGVSCPERDFKKVVDEIAKKFTFSTELFDRTAVTLTFDDGYLNQYEVAARILKERGIPAMLFGSGDALEARKPSEALIVDQLLFWTAYAPEDALRKEWSDWDGNRRSFWVRHLRPAYAYDACAKGRTVWSRLNEVYPFENIYSSLDPEYVRLRMTGLSPEKREDLRSHGWRIGWHTKSHYPLSGLNRDEAKAEIEAPQEFQAEVFSFPYGETMSVSGRDVKIAESCGYPCAVSNIENPTKLDGRYFIPRMTLPADKVMLHFKLSGFKYFLDNLRLLPRIDYQ